MGHVLTASGQVDPRMRRYPMGRPAHGRVERSSPVSDVLPVPRRPCPGGRPLHRTPHAAALVVAAAFVVAAVSGPAAALGAPAPAVAVAVDPSAADDFVSRINGLRTSRGLAPLEVHGDLVAAATDWASHLADIDRLEHDGDLAGDVGVRWSKLGENVGFGTAVGPVWDAFVASPGHFANLVDPQYTHLGVAVVVDGGRLYTVHRFMTLASDPVAAPPPAPAIAPAPAPTPAPTPAPAPTTVRPPTTTAPPTTSTTAPPTTTTTLVATPAEPDRAAAVLDALHHLTS